MPNIPPPPKLDQLTWFETHTPAWAATPEEFGLPPARAEDVRNKTLAAREAYRAAQEARQAWRNAIRTQDEALAGLLEAGRDAVKMMKSFIADSGDTTLWGRAGLTPDSPRGTAPDPTAPFDLSASLDAEGSLVVRWATRQPPGISGVIYSVRRSIDGGEFVLVDAVGEKEFIDDTIVPGTHQVSYTILAKRGRQTSPLSAALTVRFGRLPEGEGGARTIRSATTRPMMPAARAA